MSASPGNAVAMPRENADLDLRRLLPDVRVPVVVAHRKGDRAIPVEAGADMAARIPGARWVELAGDDHVPFGGDFEELVSLVEALSATTPADAPTAPPVRAVVAAFGATSADAEGSLGEARGRALGPLGGAETYAFDGLVRALRFARQIVERGAGRRAGVHVGACTDGAGDENEAARVAAAVAASAPEGSVRATAIVRDLGCGAPCTFGDATPLEVGGLRVDVVDVRPPR